MDDSKKSDLIREAQHYLSKGIACYESESVEKAYKFLQKSLAIFSNQCIQENSKIDPDRAQALMYLGNTYRNQGSLDKAIQVLKQALVIYDNDYCKTLNNLDSDRARTLMNLGVTYDKQGKKDKSIKLIKQALEIYNNDFCHQLEHLDPDRARALMNLGNTYMTQGELNKGIEVFKKAKHIYYNNYCRKKSALDPQRAKLWMNIGITYNKKGQLTESIHAYQQSLEIYKSESCKNLNKLVIERAKTLMNLGNALTDQGTLSEAIDAFQHTLKVLFSDYCMQLVHLDTFRARTWMNLGVTFRKNGAIDEAIDAYHQALKYFKGDYCLHLPQLDPLRAMTLMNLAIAFRNNGDLNGAINAYSQCLNIYNDDYCKDLVQYFPTQARAWMNLGIVYSKLEKIDNAIKAYNKALSIYSNDHCRKLNQFDHSRARTLMNLGKSYDDKGKYTQAIETLQQSLSLYNNETCKGLEHLDPSRANTWSHLGTAYRKMGEYEQAITAYQKALSIYCDNYCQELLQYNSDRAMTWNNLGITYKHKNALDEALKAYKKAEELFNSDSVGHTLPHNSNRFFLYSNMVELLLLIPNSHSWASEKSQCMIEMLDLAPLSNQPDNNDVYWQKMRTYFAEFHGHWLKYTIDCTKYEYVPGILFSIQGRELVREVLDEHMQLSANNPKSVETYYRLRQELRELLSDHRSYLGNNELVTLTKQRNEKFLIAVDSQRKTYEEIHVQMVRQQRLASKESGYSALGEYTVPNHKTIISTLNPDQGLLFLIETPFCTGILVFSYSGESLWVDGEFVYEFHSRLQKLVYSQRSDHSRRHPTDNVLRRVITANEDILADQTASGLMFNQQERRNFWSNYCSDFKFAFWDKINEFVIKNEINELIVIPHGQWHSLPLTPGAPGDVKLRYFPGLVYYGLRTGLVPGLEEQSTVYQQVEFGLLAYNCSDNPDKDMYLPGVDEEVSFLEKLYQPSPLLQVPEDYPRKDICFQMLHYAGHGMQDPQDKSSTVLVLSYDDKVGHHNFLGMHDCNHGQSKVTHAFFNGCVLGSVTENENGTPSGILPGIHRSSISVTAPSHPISDRWSSIFGQYFQSRWKTSIKKNGLLNFSLAREVFNDTLEEFLVQSQMLLVQLFKQHLCDSLINDLSRYSCIRAETIQIFKYELFFSDNRIFLQHKLEAMHDNLSDELISNRVDEVVDALVTMGEFSHPPEQLPDDIGMIYFIYKVYG